MPRPGGLLGAVTGGARPARPTPRPTSPGGRPPRPKTGGVMPRPKMGGISKSTVMPNSRPIQTGGPTPRKPVPRPKRPMSMGMGKPSGRARRAEGGVATAMKTAKPC